MNIMQPRVEIMWYVPNFSFPGSMSFFFFKIMDEKVFDTEAENYGSQNYGDVAKGAGDDHRVPP